MNSYVYLFSLLLFIISFFNKKSRILNIVLIVWMSILLFFNYANADYNMYFNQYVNYGLNSGYTSAEFMWQFLCKIFFNYRVSFEIFRFIILLVPMCLIIYIANRYAKYKNIVFSCFFAFPFFLEVVQIRDFVAISIMLFGLQFLIDETKFGNIKYIICCLLAVSFHYISLFYTVFIFAKKLNIKKFLIYVVPLIFVLTVLGKTSFFINILSMFMPSSKLQAYFLSGDWQVSTKITLLSIIIQIVIIAVLFIVKKISKDICGVEKTSFDSKLIDFSINCNLLLLLAIPIYLYTFEFTRIYRGLLLLDYIAITNMLTKKITYSNILVRVILILLIVLLFYIFILFVGVFDTTVKDVMTYNYLF